MTSAATMQPELVAAIIEWRDATMAVRNVIERDLPKLVIEPKLMIRLRSAEASLLSASIDLLPPTAP